MMPKKIGLEAPIESLRSEREEVKDQIKTYKYRPLANLPLPRKLIQSLELTLKQYDKAIKILEEADDT